MSDDLVEQLRAKRVYSDEGNCWADPGCSEAADRIEHLEDRCANLLVENGILNNRIEKLEAALREFATCVCSSNCDEKDGRVCELWACRKALDAE